MRRKLFYLVTEDWYFCSHRLALACAARDAGYEVGVITQVTSHGDAIESAGLKLFPIPFARSGRKPLQDLRTLAAIARIYRRERPDLLHHVSIKPILYGTMAARLAGIPRAINAYTGLGFLFISERPAARVLRASLSTFWRSLLSGAQCWSILQNSADLALLTSRGWVRGDRASLIAGSGVDTGVFVPTVESADVPCVMLPARLLWDKGVGEFVAAARLLHEEGLSARFVLVGAPDPQNPRSIPESDLKAWHDEGAIEWWGRRDDMAEVIRQSHVVCLPSYREGLPKVLLEAAASGRAIVATDVPGCRDVVRQGINGLLVPVRDAAALGAAIRELVLNPSRRAEFGREGRRVVEERFALDAVIRSTLALYRQVMSA